jgi:hypothetical protein
MPKQLTPEAKAELDKTLMAHVGRCTMGFVTAGETVPNSRGSGTFIRFGNVAGVLTCGHVLREILKEQEIGILCAPARVDQSQTFRVETKLTDHIIFGSEPWREIGPDLAFLRLPAATMLEIGRVASVVDGHNQRTKAADPDPTSTQVVRIVSGIVDELTALPVITGNLVTRAFQLLLNMGSVTEILDDDEMDRFQFRPSYGPDDRRPSSFKGKSGGGFWDVFIREDDFSFVQARLSGVAYWEKQLGSELHLVCHGPNSVYATLFDQIVARWPDGKSAA